MCGNLGNEQQQLQLPAVAGAASGHPAPALTSSTAVCPQGRVETADFLLSEKSSKTCIRGRITPFIFIFSGFFFLYTPTLFMLTVSGQEFPWCGMDEGHHHTVMMQKNRAQFPSLPSVSTCGIWALGCHSISSPRPSFWHHGTDAQ